MLAVGYSQHGAPRKVLALHRVDARDEVYGAPSPARQQVRVRMLASPINPMDLLMVRGLYPLLPSLPAVPGAEGVARVETLGEDVEGLEEGDHVLLPVRSGAWREALTLRAETLIKVPKALDPLQLCMLRINALSAHALLEQSGLKAGQWLAQSPAMGGVAQYVVQLAKARGIRSLNLVSQSALTKGMEAEMLAMGADRLFCQQQRGARDAWGTAHVALDGVGGRMTEQLATMLEDNRQVLCYGAMSREAGTLSVQQSVFRGISFHGFWLHRWGREQGRARVHEIVSNLATMGLRNRIARVFSLQDFAQGLAYAENSSKNQGRVILTMNEASIKSPHEHHAGS